MLPEPCAVNGKGGVRAVGGGREEVEAPRPNHQPKRILARILAAQWLEHLAPGRLYGASRSVSSPTHPFFGRA